MRFGKPKTDGERLADTIRKLEKLRMSYSGDAWSFIGAIITEYHAIQTAARASGEYETLQAFEASVLNATTFLPSVSTSGAVTRQEPYR